MKSKDIYTTTSSKSVLLRLILRKGLSREEVGTFIGVANLAENLNEPLKLGAYIRLFQLAVDITGRPGLALELNDHYNEEEMHYVARLIKYSPDLLTSLLDWSRYLRLICPSLRLELRIKGSFYHVSFHNLASDHQSHYITEYYCASGIQRVKKWYNKELIPTELYLTHPDPGYSESYRKIFKVRPMFEQEENLMVFHRKDIENPLNTYNEYMRKHLNSYTEMMAKKVAESNTIKGQVNAVLIQLLPRGLTDKGEVAAKLGIGERTLLRKLKQEGYTFREVLDNTRKALAKGYLKQDYNVTEIAYLLGFSENSSFTSAFKGWFGKSPSKVRSDLNK
ncbi:MAG: AraC family transcriptional regulator ligand-binding domain-containing protein [Spirochaetota bacterium]